MTEEEDEDLVYKQANNKQVNESIPACVADEA